MGVINSGCTAVIAANSESTLYPEKATYEGLEQAEKVENLGMLERTAADRAVVQVQLI